MAESERIPGKDGYMGILLGYAALLSELAGTAARPFAAFWRDLFPRAIGRPIPYASLPKAHP